MRATTEARLGELVRLINRVAEESERGTVIIVEGTRDRDSLRSIGVTGRIICMQSSRQNPIGLIEKLGDTRGVLVLTDFDREGVSLAKRLARHLNSQKIHANLVIWRDLRRLTRSDIRSIEELPELYHRLQSEFPANAGSVAPGYELPIHSIMKRILDHRRIERQRRRKSLRNRKPSRRPNIAHSV